MNLWSFFSRLPSLLRRRLHAIGQWRAPARWRNKALVEMPTPYLFIQSVLTSIVVYVMYPKLVLATEEFSKQISTWPWVVAGLAGFLLMMLWLIWTMAIVVSVSHIRAFGDKLFNTPKLPAQSTTVARLKERQRALRKTRIKTKMRR